MTKDTKYISTLRKKVAVKDTLTKAILLLQHRNHKEADKHLHVCAEVAIALNSMGVRLGIKADRITIKKDGVTGTISPALCEWLMETAAHKLYYYTVNRKELPLYISQFRHVAGKQHFTNPTNCK